MILSTVEMHTGGEPTRIVVDGWPEFEGTQLSGRPSVRVLLLHGPFLKADEEPVAGAKPAAAYVRFDQEDFKTPMDSIAAAIAHFRENDKVREVLPSWSEDSNITP